MTKHSMHDIQEGLGETGRFGEVFVALALLIGFFGLVFMAWTYTSFFDASPIGGDAARNDMRTLAYWYLVMGVGFGVFGAMVILSGWGRTHPESDA